MSSIAVEECSLHTAYRLRENSSSAYDALVGGCMELFHWEVTKPRETGSSQKLQANLTTAYCINVMQQPTYKKKNHAPPLEGNKIFISTKCFNRHTFHVEDTNIRGTSTINYECELKVWLVNLFPNIPLHHTRYLTSAADFGVQLIFDVKALTFIMLAFSLRVEINVQMEIQGQ